MMLARPEYELHFEAFDMVFYYAKNTPSLDDETTAEDIKKAIQQVLQDLIEFVANHAEKEKEEKRYRVRYNVDNKTFWYRKKDFRIERDTNYAKLCACFYPFSPKSGKTEWQVVSERIRKQYSHSKCIDREWIRLAIKDLDTWLENPARSSLGGKGSLLKLKGDYISRVK